MGKQRIQPEKVYCLKERDCRSSSAQLFSVKLEKLVENFTRFTEMEKK